MTYSLVSILVSDVEVVIGVQAVGHQEGRHPLGTVTSSLGHQTCHLSIHNNLDMNIYDE